MTTGTTYSSAGMYINDTKAGTKERIRRIEEILALDSVGNANLSEYEVNDGQTKIRTVYKSHSDVVSAINYFRRYKIEVMYDSGLASRITRSVDAGSM
jgi:hypothetical protein